jgi:hypothetical protein
MARRRSGDLLKHPSSLFRVGTLAGAPDAVLLERFVAGRDEAGKAAFRALRGAALPDAMVLRLRQNVLDCFGLWAGKIGRLAVPIRPDARTETFLIGTEELNS